MTTSGVTTYNNTRDEIIATAYQIITQYAPNETVSTTDTTFANLILNQMIKYWQAYSGLVWKRDFCYLFLDSSKYQYSLGGLSSDDNCTESYVTTVLSSALGTSSTSAIVSDSTGMNTSDIFLVTRDDGTLFKTTISAISGNTITLAGSSGGSVTMSSGARVFAYTSKISRPLKLSSGWRRIYTGGDSTNTFVDNPIEKIAQYDWGNIAAKGQQGTPIQFFYKRATISGQLFVYQMPTSTNNTVLGFVYDAPVQDFVNSTDTPDFPQEWLMPLSWNLALYLAPSYGLPTEQLNAIKVLADEMKELVTGYDADDENSQYYPTPVGKNLS